MKETAVVKRGRKQAKAGVSYCQQSKEIEKKKNEEEKKSTAIAINRVCGGGATHSTHVLRDTHARTLTK